MTNRWLINLALAAVVVVLALLAIFRPGGEPEPEAVPLTSLAARNVSLIRIVRAGAPEVVLERTGGDEAADWRLTAPRAARANRLRVDELLRLAAADSAARFPAADAELAQYGLDKPQLTVWLDGREIRFGANHPLNPQHYVWHDGTVHLIAAHHFRVATTGVNDWLSSRLLEESIQPTALQLPALSLERDADGVWRVTPADPELSTDRIHHFVDEWRHARALRVQPYAGTRALERVVIRYADAAGAAARTLELKVLSHKPEFVLYRADEGLEYHFAEDIGTRLMQLKPDDAGAS
ncbi:MAG TPA: DUF4340 domain-containing protein [Acidiferrobacterales bacterium]